MRVSVSLRYGFRGRISERITTEPRRIEKEKKRKKRKKSIR